MKYQETLRRLTRLPILTEQSIVAAFNKYENKDVDVCHKNIEKPGFEIATDEGTCYITERPITYFNKYYGRVTTAQQIALSTLVPMPLNIGEGHLLQCLSKINKSSNPRETANDWLTEIFTAPVATTYFDRYFSVSEALKDYRLIIWEALEAYYLGMDHIAIMSLIPVFEAGLRNIQTSILNTDPGNVSTDVFESHLKDIILQWGRRRVSSYVWYPGKGYNKTIEIDFLTHICPQSDVINSFRIYFKDILYKHSNGKGEGFNRHVIMHMFKNDFSDPSNFVRIFTCLAHITFMESLTNSKVPFFWPGSNDHNFTMAKYLISLSENLGVRRRPILRAIGIDGYQ